MISIVIPVYNAEKYLHQCVDSILHQTYRNIELILIDDGSIDSSRKICEKYESQDPRVRYFHKENGGVSSARNYGIRYAKGDYIVFVDSDDIVKPEMFEILSRNNNDFAMCGYELYDDTSNTVSVQFDCPEFCGTIRNFAQNIRNYIDPPYLLGPCFKLFRKDIIVKNKIVFPPELSYGEDAIFVFEYLTYCKTVEVSSYVGYSYRKHGIESLSGKFSLDKIDINHRINRSIHKLLEQEGILDRNQIIDDRLLECFVSYTKELVSSDLSNARKRKVFYEKYNYYKQNFGRPNRMAQTLILIAGKYSILYPIVFLFKNRA